MSKTNKKKLPDFFSMAKAVDIKSYLENFYKIEFDKHNFAICPFCGSSKTKAFSLSPKKQIVKCFSCMPKALNIVNFVMEAEKLSNHQAAKKICIDMGLYAGDDGLSEEDRKKRQEELAKKQAELQKQREIKREEEAKKDAELKKYAFKKMGEITPKLIEYLDEHREIFDDIAKIIKWSPLLDEWWFDYLGYDEFQKSLVIINQVRSRKKVYNIKHQKKWEWDPVGKKYIVGSRNPGKWISYPNSTTYPFPYEYFKNNEDERVVISFGEKDSLNLLSYGINTLTLGGISNSFEPFKNMLKGKIVYIFPDHQLIEYLSAMARYEELKTVAKEIYIVSFLHIDKTLPQKYDISDFIFDKSFDDKEEFFESIQYSCFKLTNSFIEDLTEFFSDDEKLCQRAYGFRTGAKALKFRDIQEEIVKVAKPVKSEMDEEINATEEWLIKVNTTADMKRKFIQFVGSLFDDKADEYTEKLKLALDHKQRLFKQFRKHTEVDVTAALVRDAKASGHEIASYRDDLYIWTGSHYQKLGLKELKVFIMQEWMPAAKVNMKQRVPDFIEKMVKGIFLRATALEKFKDEQNYRVINFKNGTAYLYNSGKLVFRQNHLKADAMINVLPINYDKNAKATKWKKFLNDVLPDKVEQNALMEFIGYCFLNTHSYQKFLFLLGTGANGKSIVLNVIKKFFGEEMVSYVDLQQLHSHEMIGIDGKYINIGSEINPKGLDKGQIENLKKLTAGEPTQLNPKNATPYNISGGEIPKFIFSGNNKPQGNLDGGLFRRMLLLNFDKVITKEKRIQALETRFEDEMSGIFNMAMEGLKRLLENGDFSESDNMVRNLQEYKEEANPVLAYFNEYIVMDDEYMVPRKFLYAHYKAWAEERGHHIASERTFYSRLRDINKDIKDKRTNYDGVFKEIIGKNPRFMENIRVKREGIEELKIDKQDIKTEDISLSKKYKIPVSVEEKNYVA